jgi:hypothetical protein
MRRAARAIMATSTDGAAPEGANLLLLVANAVMAMAIVALGGWPEVVLYAALALAPAALVTVVILTRGA